MWGCPVTSTTGSTSSWPCEHCPRAPNGGSRPSRGHRVRGGEGNQSDPGEMNVARRHRMLPKDRVTQGRVPQGNDGSQNLALGWTGLVLSAVLPSGSRSPSQWGSPGPRPGSSVLDTGSSGGPRQPLHCPPCLEAGSPRRAESSLLSFWMAATSPPTWRKITPRPSGASSSSCWAGSTGQTSIRNSSS